MIHIVCYLHGGDPGREGRQLWSSAWPPYTALGLFPWPACLSVWSSGFHPPLALVVSLFITFLSSTSTPPPLRSSTLCSSPTFLSSHPSPSPLLLFLLLPTTTLLLLLLLLIVSRVRRCTEFFITSHLLPARAKERCHQRHRQRARLLT